MINLLVIDDDPELLTLVSGYFLSKGMRVLVANNLAEGQKASERKRIDVLITDYDLGDGSGDELLTHFRDSHPETKMIMMSGYSDPKLDDKAKACGASVFLRKPLNIELLENWVTKLCDVGQSA